MHKRLGGLPWVWLSLLVVIIDQVFKMVIVTHLLPYVEHNVIPGFRLTLAYNTGAAFSFLDSQSGWQVWLFSVITILVCILIVWWLQKCKASQVWLCVALALVLGGAIGNLIDRLTLGYVVDYFVLYVSRWSWPAFNIADGCICVGAVMLILDMVFRKRKARREKN